MKYPTIDIAAEAAAARSSSGEALRQGIGGGGYLLGVLLGAPLPGRQCRPLTPQPAFTGLGAGFVLLPFAAKALGAILGEDPSPAIVDHSLVDVESVGIDHRNGATVTVSVHWFDAYLAASQQATQPFGGHIAVGLAIFRRIDSMQPHLGLFSADNNADGVAVTDAHHAHRSGRPGQSTGQQ